MQILTELTFLGFWIKFDGYQQILNLYSESHSTACFPEFVTAQNTKYEDSVHGSPSNPQIRQRRGLPERCPSGE